MLFKVEMDVNVPTGYDPDRFEELKAAEKARFQELQRAGTWRHIWRVVGQYSNVSIFDVPSNAELHDILIGLPLYPFMDIRVTALCRHPSSLHEDDR
ncbi:muconolactone isomerase [Caenibius tardaugens NBRC 16725]|uniref:Muconolactone Delta-isomerase n=1 Tax=Caenibius tardaugens NBRC 16725 TaxID=1219035 RepID=U2YN34_9SPHN|nr:muconolactone Delta-isomerase [Caenibius tardaugens]AZI35522.1 muconolactone Delta-isomerase [Caenibius tardaugens NBRC 16725]GAD50205.1 muconolactone isomerase [Caenibius tardaugens NBRC 16725]